MLFIGIEHQDKQRREVFEVEPEEKVDYEGELISALDDLQDERERNKNLSNEVAQLK